MNRRDVLRVLSGAVVVPMLAPLSLETRLAIGRAIHGRLAGRALRSLDAHQNATITAIAEMIIPETDTPGATTVRVNEFIDLLVTEWYQAPERDELLAGIAAIDTRSQETRGASLVNLPAADQAALLESLDGAQGPDGSAEWAFARIKDLTIYGYFTSEVVMKDVIHYQVIPGRHDGCIHV